MSLTGFEATNFNFLWDELDAFLTHGIDYNGIMVVKSIKNEYSHNYYGWKYFNLSLNEYEVLDLIELISDSIEFLGTEPEMVDVDLHFWPASEGSAGIARNNSQFTQASQVKRAINKNRSFSTCSYHSAVKPYDKSSKKLRLDLTGEQATNYSYLLDELRVLIDDEDDVCYSGVLIVYNKDTSNDNARDIRSFSTYLGTGTVEELTELISETIESANKTPQMVNVNLNLWPYTPLTRKMLGRGYQRLLCDSECRYFPIYDEEAAKAYLLQRMNNNNK